MTVLIAMKFLVDTMCGRCSRWLRILGYDADWVDAKERKFLVVRCLRESRVLITRDHRFEKTRGIRTILLVSDRVRDQIGQIARETGLIPDRERYFTRCTFCNVPVETVDKEKARPEVPPFIYETQGTFHGCARCGRIYWQGTHRDLFEKQIERVFKMEPETSSGSNNP